MAVLERTNIKSLINVLCADVVRRINPQVRHGSVGMHVRSRYLKLLQITRLVNMPIDDTCYYKR